VNLVSRSTFFSLISAQKNLILTISTYAFGPGAIENCMCEQPLAAVDKFGIGRCV
jgi:hypothetical protein